MGQLDSVIEAIKRYGKDLPLAGRSRWFLYKRYIPALEGLSTHERYELVRQLNCIAIIDTDADRIVFISHHGEWEESYSSLGSKEKQDIENALGRRHSPLNL